MSGRTFLGGGDKIHYDTGFIYYTLADPDYRRPGKVDLHLGVEVFADVMLHGQQHGPPGSPIAFKTRFGWVLAGNVGDCAPAHHAVVHHASVLTGDDILKRF